MLTLRPNCEHCNCALLPDSEEAMICSFECTFCRSCVEKLLENVCPNCGGGFSSRPIRPQQNLRNRNYLGHYPASDKPVFKSVDLKKHQAFSARIKRIPPESR